MTTALDKKFMLYAWGCVFKRIYANVNTIGKQKIKFRLLQGMVRMLLIITLDLVWHNRAPCLFSVCDKTKHANKCFNLKKSCHSSVHCTMWMFITLFSVGKLSPAFGLSWADMQGIAGVFCPQLLVNKLPLLFSAEHFYRIDITLYFFLSRPNSKWSGTIRLLH